MPLPTQPILVSRQPLQPHRPPSMQLARTNSHLGTEAVAEAVREARGRVMEDASSVDFAQEFFCGCSVLSEDRFGVGRTMFVDVLDRCVERVNDSNSDLRLSV